MFDVLKEPQCDQILLDVSLILITAFGHTANLRPQHHLLGKRLVGVEETVVDDALRVVVRHFIEKSKIFVPSSKTRI